MDELWHLEETGDGLFSLYVGPKGVPGSHQVHDIPRSIAHALACAMQSLEERARWRALERVRNALGVK